MQRTFSRARWLALLGASTSAAIPLPAQTAAGPTFRMGASSAYTMSEPFFGVETGTFARAGLNVEITTLPSGGTQVQACAGNNIDVGVADVIQITNAINAGIPLAIFAAAALYSSDAPTTALLVARDGPIVSAKDFEGKAIALNSLHSLSEISTREWLHQNGADSTLVRFLEMGGSAMIEAVAHGSVAGGLPGEPHLTIGKDRLRLFAKPYDVVAKTFPVALFFAQRSWLNANPDMTRRLTGAIYETARWANGHSDATALIVEKHAKLEAAVVQRMTRARYATNLHAQTLQPEVDIAAKYKAVKTPIAAADLIASPL
jgi:NitT/TauT family transport system substrate-binding protein